MQPTPEQIIKIGFLLKCAEDGLTIEETHARVKAAISMLKEGSPAGIIGAIMSGVYGAGKDVVNTAGKAISAVPALAELGLTVGLGAPIVAGGAGGYAAAKLTGDNDKRVLEEAKQDEVASEYERLAEEARRRTLLKRIQAQTGRRILPLSPSLGSS